MERIDGTEGALDPAQAPTAQPRHARALPSFLVEFIKRPFSTSLGDIEPHELLCWTRPGDLPGYVATEIRADALRRLSRKGPEVWQRPMGLQLSPGWDRWLTKTESAQIQRAAQECPDRPFAELSFEEVKRVSRRSFPQLIGILAKIEATSWRPPPPRPTARPAWTARARSFDHGPLVPLCASSRGAGEQALRLPWLSSVVGGDIRLPTPDGMPPAAWLAEQLSRNEVSAHLQEVADVLLAADALDCANEVRELAQAAIGLCSPAPAPHTEARWVAIFLARYVSASSARTLEEVGQEFGVTRERVRQICESILAALRSHPACTPALDRLVAMAASLAPCSAEDADTHVARQLGSGVGILGVLDLLEDMRRPTPLRHSRARVSVRGKYREVRLLERGDAEGQWAQSALRYAAAECVTLGCTSVIRVAGALALQDEVAPGRDAIVGVLRQAPGFRWLDEGNGWFCIGDTGASGAAARIRKILSVAEDPVTVEEISEAFATDTRWFRDDDGRALAMPPSYVLQALIGCWPWVKLIQHTRLTPTQPIDRCEVLTDLEAAAVKVIEEGGGVAAARQFYSRLTPETGVSKMGVAFMLASSPILVRLDRGLYALRGRPLNPEALARARAVLHGRPAAAGMETDSFCVRVTQASLQHEQYAVPERFKGRLAGRVMPIAGTGMEARITASGALRGINAAVDGAAEGDWLLVRVIGDELEVQRMPVQDADG